MAKPKKEYKLVDFLGHEVNPGDAVVLLYKIRGFRGLDNARLANAIYVKHGQYEYEFKLESSHGGWYEERIRTPEVVKITKEIVKVKLSPAANTLKKEVRL